MISLLKECKPSIIIFPLALGGHIDHGFMNSIGRDLLHKKVENIAFYEDLPYASKMTPRKIKRIVRRLNRRLIPFSLPGVEIERKLSLLRTYKSQLREEDLSIIRRHMALQVEERVWATLPVIELLQLIKKKTERSGTDHASFGG